MSAATIAEPRETGPRVPTASRRNLQILFYAGEHHLGGLLRDGDDGLASSLEVLGKPLSAYNVRKLNSRVGEVTRILLPNGLRRTVSILERELPFCQIEEYSDVGRFDEVENLVRLPLNSMVLEPEQGGYLVKRLVYPWDILEGMTELLRADVKETRVAESASVSKTCVLSGPCFISEGPRRRLCKGSRTSLHRRGEQGGHVQPDQGEHGGSRLQHRVRLRGRQDVSGRQRQNSTPRRDT